MSRFGSTGSFLYNAHGDVIDGTSILLTQSQMPHYPFEESRVTDRTVYRNISGDAYVYQNYNKLLYTFRWTYLDEAKALELKRMFDSNGRIRFDSNGTTFGQFFVEGIPEVSEVQHELYDISVTLQEA